MSQKFTHLHVHSHYSLLDGLPKIDQLLDRVQELGMDSVAVTDHGNLYGAIEFYKKAKKRGIKPIIGAEIYLAFEDMRQKRPGLDDKIYHMVLLAKNEQGYQNLVKILTAGHLEGYYYKPRVDEEFLRKHSEGLIALSACLAGRIARYILAGHQTEAEQTALRYQEIFGKGNFYLEIQNHPNIADQEKANKGIVAISKNTGIPLVATADSHYLRPEDAEAQDILMLINTGARADDPERLTLKNDDFSLKSGEDMARIFAEHPEALENTNAIADACNLEISIGKTKLPEFPLPEGKTANEYLVELCEQGLKEKPEVLTYPGARARLDFELDVIKQTGFAGYFLIVQDFVRWAKEKRIVVGPGRGSAGGSLVAYLLKITGINPLEYNLLFERFLNPSRISMPDIDLDFADTRRDEVIEYVAQKYGRDHVAQIITFGTMAARASVRDVGRALGYEYSYCDKVAKLIPFGNSLSQALESVEELQSMYKKEEKARKLLDLAKKLEGVARHASTHACGVVISADPLTNSTPLQYPTQNDQNVVTQYEMHAVEDIGLLKMDFLGLKNLTLIEDTLKRIYAVHGMNIDIERLPFDDEATYKLFQEGDTIGIFQAESGGMRRHLRELRPTHFEDIIAMIALYRPGPMEFIPDYINRKYGRLNISYIHPKLEPILKNTYGIAVYQEQIMQIARDLAGFSMAEADVLRKAVGKKIKELLDEQQEKMIQGMVQNGIEKRVAQQIWEWILPFARYGFNRSHSAAYAIIAYQTAWLKANYPVEFMSALMTLERNDVERVAFLIEEAKKMGLETLPPNINESFSFFSIVPGKKQIRFGLAAIKNVGEGIVEAIIQERKANGPYSSIQNFVERVQSKNLNKKSLESMIRAGVFDEFGERNQLISNMDRLLEAARERAKATQNGQKDLFGGIAVPASNGLKLQEAEPATESQKLLWEKELLGLYVTSHPLKPLRHILEKRTFSLNRVKFDSDFQMQMSKNSISIGGIVSTLKKIMTKAGKPMLFLTLEDLTEKIEVVVFPKILEKNPMLFQENRMLLLAGRLDSRNGELKFIAEQAEELHEELPPPLS
ncbi:MAG: DNA polymerase III subunit alpha [Candidatus Yanofskybacteria bacterium]|nr:DNA polymerase III subunit alpha [Candidatus Yanofskybacteria bacterium]